VTYSTLVCGVFESYEEYNRRKIANRSIMVYQSDIKLVHRLRQGRLKTNSPAKRSTTYSLSPATETPAGAVNSEPA